MSLKKFAGARDDRLRKAYCIRYTGGTRVAWSSSEAYVTAVQNGSGKGRGKLLSDERIETLATGTHELRNDLNENDHKPHLSLRTAALEATAAAVLRWQSEGIKLDQHQYSIQHEIVTLRRTVQAASRQKAVLAAKYDEKRMDAKQRTASLKERSRLQQEISSSMSRITVQQRSYRDVTSKQLRSLPLQRLRHSLGPQMRSELESQLRKLLSKRFCDKLFNVVWDTGALETLRFEYMSLSKQEVVFGLFLSFCVCVLSWTFQQNLFHVGFKGRLCCAGRDGGVVAKPLAHEVARCEALWVNCRLYWWTCASKFPCLHDRIVLVNWYRNVARDFSRCKIALLAFLCSCVEYFPTSNGWWNWTLASTALG